MPEKVLIAFHGNPFDPGRPVTGNALRARGLALGLKQAGFEVTFAVSHHTISIPAGGMQAAGFEVYPYGDARSLKTVIDGCGIDVLVHLQPEELSDLQDSEVFVVADLFAPRELESRFQPKLASRTMAQRIAALSRADAYLCTSNRQKYYYTGWLMMSGVDPITRPLLVTPLCSVPVEPASLRTTSDEPVFVAGGVAWPWIDLGPAVKAVLKVLEANDKGRLRLYQGRYPIDAPDPGLKKLDLSSPRLEVSDLVPYNRVLSEYSNAVAALDSAVFHHERELAMSFRTMDYLACGLPVMVTRGSTLAHVIEVHRAGWIVDPEEPSTISEVVESILSDTEKARQMGENAYKLSQGRFSPGKATSVLSEYLKSRPTAVHKQPTIIQVLSDAADRGFREREAHRQTITKLEECTRRLGELKVAVEKKDEHISFLQERLDLKQGLLEETRREREATRLKVAQLTQELEHANSEVINLKAESADLKHAAAEYSRLSSKVAGLEQTADDRRRTIERLQDEIKELSKKLEASLLHAERQQVAREAEAAKAERLAAKIDELVAHVNEARANATELAEALAVMEREKTRFENEARVLGRELENARLRAEREQNLRIQEVSLRDGEITRLESELEKALSRGDRLESRTVELESQLDAERRRLDSARHELAHLDRQLAALRADPLYRMYALLKERMKKNK